MPEFRFLTQTGTQGPNSDDRRIIRSHVMIGRNRGRWLPLGSKRHAKAALPMAPRIMPPAASDPSNNDRARSGSASISASIASSSPSPRPRECCTPQLPVPVVPCMVGSVVSSMSLADTVETAAIEVVIQFSSIAKQLLFPLEPCIFFDKRAENWVAPLATDSAFLHAKLFTSLYYYDAIVTRRFSSPSLRVRRHYHKTLQILRARLSSTCDDARLSNHTVSAVLCLTGQAFSAGDSKTALAHLRGIKCIIDMRGGLESLSSNEKLATEILRCDLGIAMHDGTRPVFHQDSQPPQSYWAYPFFDTHFRMTGLEDNATVDRFWKASGIESDHPLAPIIRTLAEFSLLVNTAAASQQCITVGDFLQTMASTMYVLLMAKSDTGSFDETIRVGLLCYCCTVFLQWQHLGMEYPHLTSHVRKSFSHLAQGISSWPTRLLLWALTICAVAVPGASEHDTFHPLLRQTVKLCDIESWDQMRSILKEVLWIEMVHDRQGKRIYDAVVARTNLPKQADGVHLLKQASPNLPNLPT
ncbi:hypothetical protein GGR56DRAFT_541101 [Xylariaceae sp. FL0804]|nr:hypothetical protein GGR56DRAFT_541101 [Xylariaceae sp. FL0804]